MLFLRDEAALSERGYHRHYAAASGIASGLRDQLMGPTTATLRRTPTRVEWFDA
jgi:hypothetical protein